MQNINKSTTKFQEHIAVKTKIDVALENAYYHAHLQTSSFKTILHFIRNKSKLEDDTLINRLKSIHTAISEWKKDELMSIDPDVLLQYEELIRHHLDIIRAINVLRSTK